MKDVLSFPQKIELEILFTTQGQVEIKPQTISSCHMHIWIFSVNVPYSYTTNQDPAARHVDHAFRRMSKHSSRGREKQSKHPAIHAVSEQQ